MKALVKTILIGTGFFVFGGAFASGIDDDLYAGNDFLTYLAQELDSCASGEAREKDFKDSRLFKDMAEKARNGEMVYPSTPNTRLLPSKSAYEVRKARQSLVHQLELGARDADPAGAAATQARYECWIQELEENFQPGSIQASKDDFYASLQALQSPLPSAVIYFPVDSSTLTSSSRSKLSEVARNMKQYGVNDIALQTYASTTANYVYNLELTKRRADSVRAYLKKQGVDVRQIVTRTYGEGDLAIPTNNNVENNLNRRAVIKLIRPVKY